jgi:hypothetical protein
MTALPPQVAERCAKIVGQLSSDNDGTVLAAGRALVSTLRGAGLGITDLSDHIVAQPREVVRYIHKPQEPPRAAPRDFDYGRWRQTWGEFDPHRCNKAQAAKLRAASPGFLSTWEANFIGSLVRQMDQGRELSPKQQEILRGIHNRYEERHG